MLFAQASGAVIFGPLLEGVLILVFAAIDALLLRLGVRLFRREEILSQVG
jgi:hypothetical protein